jgi:NAD(P)-dependent dehydrogenase (short-subunit alcohol dehydrogenase family)
MELKDKVVMITGGAIRVGRCIALYMAEKGAHVSFSWYDNHEDWERTRQDIEGFGVKAMATRLDVRKTGDIRSWAAATHAEFGRVDVLINSASVWLKAPFLNISEEAYDAALDINLKGPFMCAQAVVPIMQAQGAGVIINITDVSGFQVWPGYAPHAASKAGLASLTKTLAAELAPTVRVNAVSPGTVLLPDHYTPEVEQWALEKTVLGRIGSPLDVARTVAFLIESEYATGSIIFMDGGMSLV